MPERDSARYEEFKKMLLDKKKKIWGDLRDELFRKLGKEYNAQFDTPHDIEELSLIDYIEETGLSIADIRRGELEQMDTALKKLEDGTYGVCAACGTEIDGERLKVQPFATLCVKCKDAEEG